MGINVKLQVFEGPLDLLLHLIDKNKVNIYDIPIAMITEQYMEYVNQMDKEDLNVVSEFLVMAATLLDIKSKMLLPKEVNEEGVERDLAGLPVINTPEDMDIWDNEDPQMVRLNGALITMVKNLRRNEAEGLVLPHGYEVKLLSTGGTRQFDTNAIINRYDTKIAQTVLADFIMLGHEKTGSFALSSDKTELFSVALGAFLDVICETFNNQGIPSLIDINGSHFDGIEDYPTLAHGDVDKRDITKLSTFLKDMVGTGILIPDEELEDYVREAANLPERTDIPDTRTKDEQRENQRRAPEKTVNESEEPEVDPEENQTVEEAKKRLGR